MIRNRVKNLRFVKASELKPHPKNWRTHPLAQQNALRGVLQEIGYADACLARELPDGTLELIDGHLRQSLDKDAEIPVLVLDVTAEEAEKVLVTLDPLAAMAEADKDKLESLLKGMTIDSEEMKKLIASMAAEHKIKLDDGKEYDESVAESVQLAQCPKCGHEFPL